MNSLPEVALLKIYSYLSQKDCIAFRSTCSHTKKCFDNSSAVIASVEFSIELFHDINELISICTIPYVKKILKIRIKCKTPLYCKVIDQESLLKLPDRLKLTISILHV